MHASWAAAIIAATLGVDVGWQPIEDGTYEYIIQIEPELASRLNENYTLEVGVPPEVRNVSRYRIVIGRDQLPMTTRPGDATGRGSGQATAPAPPPTAAASPPTPTKRAETSVRTDNSERSSAPAWTGRPDSVPAAEPSPPSPDPVATQPPTPRPSLGDTTAPDTTTGSNPGYQPPTNSPPPAGDKPGRASGLLDDPSRPPAPSLLKRPGEPADSAPDAKEPAPGGYQLPPAAGGYSPPPSKPGGHTPYSPPANDSASDADTSTDVADNDRPSDLSSAPDFAATDPPTPQESELTTTLPSTTPDDDRAPSIPFGARTPLADTSTPADNLTADSAPSTSGHSTSTPPEPSPLPKMDRFVVPANVEDSEPQEEHESHTAESTAKEDDSNDNTAYAPPPTSNTNDDSTSGEAAETGKADTAVTPPPTSNPPTSNPTTDMTPAATPTEEGKPWGLFIGACFLLFVSIAANAFLVWVAWEARSRLKALLERNRLTQATAGA